MVCQTLSPGGLCSFCLQSNHRTRSANGASLSVSLQGSSSPNISPQEKTKKIYDIWVKGATFPPDILSRLSDIVSGKDKGAYHDYLYAKYLSTDITIISCASRVWSEEPC